MSAQLKVFTNGVTGYIGGAVLERLLEIPNISIRALIRKQDKADKLKQFGVTPVMGSLDDVDLIKQEAYEADVVLAMADCDHLASAKAIMEGLKIRYEQSGKKGKFIQTSGTGELTVDSKGLGPTDIVWKDDDPDQLETIPADAIHRHVDTVIVEESKKGYMDTYIIMPSTIWGLGTGKLVDAGIVHRHSVQLPTLIKASIDRGQAGMVGKGLNVWPHVEIHELADLYIALFNAVVQQKPGLGQGREGYYFAESGEYRYYEACKEYARVLHELGKSKTDEPTPFTKADIDKYFGGSEYAGSSGRCEGNRSRSLGWKPTKTTQDFYAAIRDEVLSGIEDGF